MVQGREQEALLRVLLALDLAVRVVEPGNLVLVAPPTRVVRIQDRNLEPESAGWPATFDIPADSIGLAPDADTLGVPSGTDSMAVPDTGTAPGS